MASHPRRNPFCQSFVFSALRSLYHAGFGENQSFNDDIAVYASRFSNARLEGDYDAVCGKRSQGGR